MNNFIGSVRYNFLVVLIIFIIVSLFSDQNPMKAGIASSLCVFGASWLIITLFTLILSPWSTSIICIALSIIIMATGGYLIKFDKPKIIPTQNQLGNCPQAEWILRINYKNQYGIDSSLDIKCCGNYKKADDLLILKVDKWNKENPLTPCTSYEKILYFIPLEYAKKNNYPTIFCSRY